MLPVQEIAGHGLYPPLDLSALLADDHELHLVTADAGAWADAHPCDCEALCVCERS